MRQKNKTQLQPNLINNKKKKLLLARIGIFVVPIIPALAIAQSHTETSGKKGKVRSTPASPKNYDRAIVETFIQALVVNALDGLRDNSVFPSTITKKKVIAQLKKIAKNDNIHFVPYHITTKTKAPTEQQFAVINLDDIEIATNDDWGDIVVSIKNFGKKRSFYIFGFNSNYKQKFDATQGANLITALALDKTKTATNALNAKPANGSLEPSDLKYTFENWAPNDVNGTITWRAKLTLGVYRKILDGTISGFISNADLEKVSAFVQGLSDESIDSLKNANKLSSTLEKSTIMVAIKAASEFDSFTKMQKSLLKDEDVAITYGNANGVLTVTISNHGEKKVLQVTGFKTGQKALEEKVQALTSSSLEGLDISKPASEVTTEQVLAKIKAIPEIAILPNDVKAMMILSNITTKSDNLKGELTVTISEFGEDKELKMTSFKIVNSKETSDNELSNIAISGIAIGSIASVGILGYLIYYFLKRKKTK